MGSVTWIIQAKIKPQIYYKNKFHKINISIEVTGQTYRKNVAFWKKKSHHIPHNMW